MQEMERKEREILDRLRDTFKSVEEQESRVRSLEGYGRRANVKHARSVVAEYISSPTGSGSPIIFRDNISNFDYKSNKATFKPPKNIESEATKE